MTCPNSSIMDYGIWILYLLIINYRQVFSQSWKISTSCFGTKGLNCSYHHFACSPRDHIAVNGAEYFYKDNVRCGMGVGNCDVHRQSCCIPEQNDCSLPYTRADMERLKRCLRSSSCSFKTPWNTRKCVSGRRMVQFSSYSVIFYECVKEAETINFCDGSMEGNSISIMYDPTSSPKSDMTCACLTSGKGEGHTPLFIEALDVHLGNLSAPCSALTMNCKDREFVYNCNSNNIHPSQMLLPVNATLPIRSELQIFKDNPPHRVWIRIQAKKPIRVTCRKYSNEEPPTIHINVTEPRPSSSSFERTIWAVIGGGVGGLLCVISLTVVCILCIRRHRSKKAGPEDITNHDYFVIEPSSMLSAETSTDDAEYYEIQDDSPKTETDHYYSSADSLGRHAHTAHAISPYVISGYDHLRLKSCDTVPSAPNYGRLNHGMETSDSNGYMDVNDNRQVVLLEERDRNTMDV